MVNFFSHQQEAKRNTTLLVVLFLIAFALIIGVTTLVIGIGFGVMESRGQPGGGGAQEFAIDPQAAMMTALVVFAVIATVMLVKWLALRPGGHVVAEQLGGQLVSPDSQDPTERRVLNVVEEMAIAANMPVPAVYILPEESAINAFAAGYKSKDAVIGLTRGAIDSFSREQLQAVVAHEFSHILNGDMRLNIRLIAALAGILFISHMGRMLIYSGAMSRGRNNKNNIGPLIGIGLLIVGAIGVLFGNLIKAAVSRQREYLADAAAVQFTRNPDGLAGALKQIGARQQGSKIEHKNADEAAHLFFGQAISRWFSLMSTHPPLEQRIKRLQPSWDGNYPEPQDFHAQPESPDSSAAANAAMRSERFAALAIPALLLEQLHQPQPAAKALQNLFVETLTDGSTKFDAAQQLALVELALPALRKLGKPEQAALLEDLKARTENADLFHWGLYQLLARQLLPDSAFAKRLGKGQAVAVTLRALADAGHSDAAEAEAAYQHGIKRHFKGVPDYSATEVTKAQLERALNTLSGWSPTASERLLKCWIACVQYDREITADERKLLLTLSACIDEPLPDEILDELQQD